MIGDNPAARLLAILEEGQTQEPKKSCREVWRKILEIESGSEALLISRLGRLMELPQQTVLILERDFPNQRTTYEHWSKRIGAAFSNQNLDGEWQTFRNQIDVHTLTYLRLTADLINTKQPSTALDKQTIEELRSKVDHLLQEALVWESDAPVKDFVVRTLQRIVVALDEYRISGALPVMEAIEIAFGHASFDQQYREAISSSSFGQQFIQVLSVVASSITVVLGTPQLPEHIQLMLEKLGEHVT